METDGETLEMEKQPEEEQSEEQPQGDQPNEPLLPEEPDQEGDNEGSEEVILPDQQDTSSNTHAPIPAPAPTPPATRPPLALQFCYSCSSANNASCATHPYNQKKCNPYNGRHTCYTLYKLDTKVTTRGCWIELTEQDQSYCKIKRKECEQCHEPACNTRETIMAGGAQLGLFSICFYCILSLGIWLKPM
ncbi:uncharacterized protein LOC115631388 [Scaptodrosophila lebanonensis]|uniref:Uncharacterized protein LOC115631388 n=1 Tax=Drosophila lebanonensis TaxID=7225 RepID=A0A6J2U7L7_DROLE|nr:uncharacterized protein LOC115631388 [Scaptodrosophila lebanonensis]